MACQAPLNSAGAIPPRPLNSLPFSRIQIFLAVARAGSFGGAARELGVSRSAVSQGVQDDDDREFSAPRGRIFGL
jgi:Bacterial regulatory helix-turn-helix protein, lysR family